MLYQYRVIQIVGAMSSDHPTMNTLMEKINLAARSGWTVHTWTSVPHGAGVLHTVLMQQKATADA